VVSLEKALQMDYSYIKTVFGSQGLGAKHVFTLLESWRRNLVNQKSFYVALSRTKENISIYTDSAAKLIKGLDKRTGDKTSAMGELGQTRDTFKTHEPERITSSFWGALTDRLGKAKENVKSKIKPDGISRDLEKQRNSTKVQKPVKQRSRGFSR
jgi:hypothetical protein